MSDIVLRAEKLGKRYVIGRQQSGDLREAFGARIRSLFHPTPGKDFWALKNVDFEIKRGDAVGIIGRNGAGKSTLLKILSRITYPTTGRFELNGRVSSLLEVGTGFHPELTGRENVFLNGTILGMGRGEIRRKFDEIVDFSGVEEFIDTPVKHYSSGMKVRLAFSVAAHLEPDVLIVDEVLAVGDAEFQKKCLGKMDEVRKGQGRTVIFVSHNLAAVSQLCDRGILLMEAQVAIDSDVDEVINYYLNHSKKQLSSGSSIDINARQGSGMFRVDEVKLTNGEAQETAVALTGKTVVFQIFLDRRVTGKRGAFRIDFAIDNAHDVRIGWFSSDAVGCDFDDDFNQISLRIPKFPFGSGKYYLTIYITWNGEVVDYLHQGFAFSVEDGDFFGTGKIIPKSQTFIYADHEILSDNVIK